MGFILLPVPVFQLSSSVLREQLVLLLIVIITATPHPFHPLWSPALPNSFFLEGEGRQTQGMAGLGHGWAHQLLQPEPQAPGVSEIPRDPLVQEAPMHLTRVLCC